MKLPTWKQLRARARRLGVGMSDSIGGHQVTVIEGLDEVCSFESWLSKRADDRVLRAAVAAALDAMTPAKSRQKTPAPRKERRQR